MEEKRIRSEHIGICRKLITFIMNTIIARGFVKRLSLGHSMSQDLEPMIPTAKPEGIEIRCFQAHPKANEEDSSLEVQVHYKQPDDDGFESWTQVDKLGPVKAQEERAGSDVKHISISTTNSQTRAPKKVLSIRDVGKLEKGKGVITSSEKFLTLAMEGEDEDHGERSKLGLRRARPLFYVAPNINEKSDAFIRSRKEAMRRNYSLEPSVS